MATHTTSSETLWVLLLVPNSKSLILENIAFFLFAILSTFLFMTLLYWSHPGGHAWGKYWLKSGATKAVPIPGPRGFPLIGSMALMANLAHHNLLAAAVSHRAKRLMAFSLGETRVVVTCDPDVAKEILKSSAFANRPVKESAYSLMFNRAIGFAPYGVYWRTLRRIASTHLFCPKQLSCSEAERSDIASQMVAAIGTRRDGNIRVRDILKRASLNNMMRTVFGRKYDLFTWNEETDELSRLVEEGYELLGQHNWSDHIPWLASLDLQRIRYRCSRIVPRVKSFVSRIISDHRAQASFPKRSHDFVDVLLSLQGPDTLADSDMVAVLWEMIFRGTDTVAVLIEWILARIVLHPDVQEKLHHELDAVVGESRPVTESDVPSLVWLQAVVKEVLRLHPPGPLLSWARLSIIDTSVAGLHVPAGTTAMVNMWAISRDPAVWSDPLEFMPERFVGGHGEADFLVMGSDLRLAPFGSGRRACPGKTFGLNTVAFWVATLLHEFKWVEPNEEKVDLSEVLRLSCEMARPLVVKVRPRRTPSYLFDAFLHIHHHHHQSQKKM